MKPSKSLPRRLVRGVFVSFASLVLIIGVGEIVVRLTTNVILPVTRRDPVLGCRYVQAFEGRVYDPESEREVLLRFNQLGFRGPDRPLEKPPGVRRVALLGDSMIAALSVDEQETAAALLEERLNESNPEATWEVLNFGVSGSSTGQELVLYREVVSKFDPDIVLLAYFVGNDLADNCTRMTGSPRIYFELDPDGQLEQQPFNAARASSSALLNRHSRFYVWMKKTTRSIRTKLRKKGGMPAGRWIYCTDESEDVQYAWALSSALIQALQAEASKDGATFGLIGIPSAVQIYDDYFDEVKADAGDLAAAFDQDYPDVTLAAISREHGFPYCTMTAQFREQAPSRSRAVADEWLFYEGRVHFNTRGNALAAAAMHRFVTEELLPLSAKPE